MVLKGITYALRGIVDACRLTEDKLVTIILISAFVWYSHLCAHVTDKRPCLSEQCMCFYR